MGCTGVKLITKENEVFWGRTQDFELQYDYKVAKIPSNYNFSNMYTPFKSKYTTMGVLWAETNVKKYPVYLDGINEHGLVGGSFYFDNFYNYQSTETILKNKKIPLRGEEVATWILTNYKNVNEIINKLNDDVQVTNAAGPMDNRSMPQHSMFMDSTGRSIVVEPTLDNGFEIFENKIGVFTNAPNFKWHLTNLKIHLEKSSNRKFNYKLNEEIPHFEDYEYTSGLVGIPSDYKPESRFIRAAYNKLLSPEVTRETVLSQMNAIISTVNNPIGSLRIKNEDGEILKPWTQFTVIHDQSEKIMYVHSYNNRTMQKVKLEDEDDTLKTIEFYSFQKDEIIINMEIEK